MFLLFYKNFSKGIETMNNKKIKKDKQQFKTLGIPVLNVINNIVVSKKEVWAYYLVSQKPYDFLSANAKVGLANSTMTALSSLCQTADKRIDCHLLIDNIPFNVDAWQQQMKTEYAYWNGAETPVFKKFLEEQVKDLRDSNFQKRMTLLGVKLFQRGSFDFSSINILEFGFKDIYSTAKKTINSLFQFQAEEIMPEEEKRAIEMEKEIYRILSNGGLKGIRVDSEYLLLSLKQRFFPSMPTPYLEVDHKNRMGMADIVIETGGEVEVKPRFIKISQNIDGIDYTGYRATLSFAEFPEPFEFPSSVPPFLYRGAILPFTVNCRFSLIPTEEMKKKLKSKQLENDDEIKNLQESGQRANAGFRETLDDLNELDAILEKEPMPWLSGNYRVTITAPNEELLKEWITSIKQEYHDCDTTLIWTTGDQLQLMREEMVGGKLEINSFAQITNLALLGISGFNFGSSAGDKVYQTFKSTK